MTSIKSNTSTIRDVARLADVSVATVSRFINNATIVSPDSAERVREAMETLKFVPHSAARKLATHKTNTLGLLLTDIHSDFFTPLLKGIESETSANNFDLLISTMTRLTAHQPLPLGPHNTDGVMIFLDRMNVDILEEYRVSGLPVVLIHHTAPEGLAIPSVTIENKSSLERVMAHLIDVHGRRNIAFLRGLQGNEDSDWRELGYRSALESRGLTVNPGLVGEGGFDREIAYRGMKKLISSHPEIDAVFTGDDEAAIGALMALREAGRRVPEDVSVIGFDDQLVAPYLTPPLTTVHAPTEEVGRTAARQLIRLLREGCAEPLTLMPTELVIRRSCGCEYQNIQNLNQGR
jgi:LacI family transcriptional regulator